MFDDDTLIEGEMEDRLLDEVYPTNITKEQTHRVFCATDVLVWHGRPVGVGHHGPSGQQQCMMNATQRTELLHTWYAEFERCNNNLVVGAVSGDVEIILSAWHTNIVGLYRSLFVSPTDNTMSSTTVTHIVARHNNKVATQKDALMPLIFDDNDIIADDDAAIIADDDAAIIANDDAAIIADDDAAIIADDDAAIIADDDAAILADEDEDARHRSDDPLQPEETEYASARLEPEAVRHLFYVRATHMPDVYELYREEVSASLSRSPDAFAGVRSMRDSLIMRSLFSASSGGGATLPQCMFVFDTVIGKWTPE
jgi:hypothetical protein